MSTHKNLMTVCCAAVLAFGLAACGSSDDDNVPVTMTDDDTKMSPMPVAVDLASVTDGTTAEAGTLEIEAGMSKDSGNTAFACASDGDDCTVTVTVGDDGTVTAASTGGDVTAGNSAAHQMTLDDVAGPTPATPMEMAAAATKAAATKVTAINKEAGQVVDAGPGGSEEAYTLTIKRPRSGTEIKIEDPANAGDDDPKFIMQDVDLGEGRTMHVRTMPENDDGEVEEEVVIVKTDIKAPKATKFADVAGQELTLSTNTMNDSPTPTNEALLVLPGTDDANLPKIKSPAFAAPAAAVLTFARYQEDSDDSVDGAQTIAAFETAGTYNGAPGTYKCNDDGVACTVTLDAKGAITAMTDSWIFTPDAGATSDVADAEHLNYGFWLKRTTKDGGTTYNEVETFAEAIGFEETTGAEDGLGAVTGSATYEGDSVGVYVKNVLDDQANIVSATSGHFSADVELTANFGGGNVPNYNRFTIEGTVTDFVLQHDEENDWAVKLGLVDFSTRGEGDDPGESDPGSTFTPMFNGVATGDSTALAGSWNGMFHGEAGQLNHDNDDGTTPLVNTPPAAVTGEFNANFTDGTVAGGFGANKQ